MSSAVLSEHPLIASVDDNGAERITVFDHDTSVICGAFRPAGHLYWRLYLTAATAEVASHDSVGTKIPPQHLLTARRQDACRWLEVIAHLYTHPGAVGG